MLIDECHFLNESRGAALEAGSIGRLKMIARSAAMQQVSVYKDGLFP